MSVSTWTDRAVQFTPYPRTDVALWETFFDSLPEHYWEQPRWKRWYHPPGLSAVGLVVRVSGLPWWVPAWRARKTLAKLAVAAGISGDVLYFVERTVLVNTDL